MKRPMQALLSPRPIRRRDPRRRLVLSAIAVAVVALSALAWWWFPKGDGRPEYREHVVERGRLTISVDASGIVTPQNRIDLNPPLAGRIDEILVDEGDDIEKGQVLAWISSSDRASLIDAARAQGSDEARKWEEAYKPTPLVAPLPGFIIARNAEPGQSVTKSSMPLVMADRLIVRAQVDETDMGKVEIGQRVRVSLDAYPDIRIPGRLDHLAYEARQVNNVTVYDIEIELMRRVSVLRSGMTATVAVILAEQRDALLVPLDALTEHDEGLAVLLKKADGSRAMTPVKIGLFSEGLVEIAEGVKEGDVLLVSTRALPPRKLSNEGSPFMPGNFRRTRRGWRPAGRRR